MSDDFEPFTTTLDDLPDAGPVKGKTNKTVAIIVAILDGSVRFISETIDAGDPTRTATSPPPGFPPLVDPARPQDYAGPSLYGIWGSLGSMAGGETVQAP